MEYQCPDCPYVYIEKAGDPDDESTEILGKGRKIKPAEESLRWIGLN